MRVWPCMLPAVFSHVLCDWGCPAVAMKKAISHSADHSYYENWGFEVKEHTEMFSSFIFMLSGGSYHSLAHSALHGYLFHNKFFAVTPSETTYTSLAVGLVANLSFPRCFTVKIYSSLSYRLASTVSTLILPAKIPY